MKISSYAIETMLAQQGITKAHLAEKCGLSRQSVSTIVRRGTCEPKTAGKLARGLGIPVSEILEREV